MNPNLIMKVLAIATVSGVAASAVQARESGMPRSERTFERLDTNKDGELAVQELEAKSQGRFMRLDADKDDQVTRAELEDWLSKIAQRRIERILKRMDSYNDTAISKAEVEDYVAGLVLAADVDKSGGVTLQEARDYHVAKRKARSEARKAASAATRQ